MRAAIRAICRPPAAPGLALAGLAPIEAVDGPAAAAAIADLAATPARGGVILIEDTLHRALPAALRRQIQRDGLPILVPFPGPALGRAPARPPEQEILDLLRRSVGYLVRLR
jgi:vacuolar-type H+-ATPase subunit F/Vma7